MELDAHRQFHSATQRSAWWLHYLKARWQRKERATVSSLARFIAPGAVILDVGSHFGYFAKEFARIHARGCQVHCFEPFPYSYSILTKVAGGFGNVVLHSYGLSDTAGAATLRVPVKRSGKIGPGLAHLGREEKRDYIAVTIKLDTLDRFAEREQLKRLDFIKCDVEGAELLVFRGGVAAIETRRPVVYCEINAGYTARVGYSPEELFGFFRRHGYRVWRVHKPFCLQPCNQYQTAGDYLFARFDVAAASA